MIVLISAQDTLVQAFTDIVSGSTPCIHFMGLDETQVYLRVIADDGLIPNLIMIDSNKTHQLVAECRQICQTIFADTIPIVAIINHPQERQVVLTCGADDYLLFPLLP